MKLNVLKEQNAKVERMLMLIKIKLGGSLENEAGPFKVLGDPHLNNTCENKVNIKALKEKKITKQEVHGLLHRDAARDEFPVWPASEEGNHSEHWLGLGRHGPEPLTNKPECPDSCLLAK